ncbi:hypothetical protein [Pseudomonas cremoricolorata]|uniref:Uncharacterized protein n=1 Tax=Pseudomonas cremoricolorata TaxID=157783 RepID=A0A089WV82_9PSED|nr:hypothetical protein [Pseudomonas cremoricolorata]AIR91114.1 hypothetical protein LK03_18390 [Pseudomonas cremoricolorata]
MSDMHEQAMQAIYRQVLERLLEQMAQAQRASLQLLIQRLLVAAGGAQSIGRFRLVLLHGPDRPSAHLLACLRAAQLSIAQRSAQTFQLRVVVVAQPGAGAAELISHERCFNALLLHSDPRVELLVARAEGARPFDVQWLLAEPADTLNRKAWLLSGHLPGNPLHSLLGSRLWLQLAHACAPVLRCEEHDCVVVMAMPASQRRRLLAWGRRCLRLADPEQPPLPNCIAAWVDAVARLHAHLSRLPGPAARVAGPGAKHACAHALQLLDLDELLQHLGRTDRLDRMLGLGEDAPCAAPGLQAFKDPHLSGHVLGLQAHYLGGDRYPQTLRSAPRTHHLGRGQSLRLTPQALREDAEQRLLRGYGVADRQMACLLFNPFIDRGRRLEAFVEHCHPNMAVALPYLHSALQGQPCPASVVRWLVGVSGLSLIMMRGLYALRLDERTLRLSQQLMRRDAALRMQATG